MLKNGRKKFLQEDDDFTQNTGKNSGRRGRVDNLRPWKPGESGNPGGRPRKALVDDALESILAADGGEKARQVAEMLIQRAIRGTSGRRS